MTTLTLSLHRCARQIKRLGRLVTGHDAIYRYDAKPRKLSLGTIYGGWVIAPDGLNANSVMYSFGVGNDISFDLAAIEKFGITVHGFDPSPEAIRWISEKTDLPARYIFHPYGLALKMGTWSFIAPRQVECTLCMRGTVGWGKLRLRWRSGAFPRFSAHWAPRMSMSSRWISKAESICKLIPSSRIVLRLDNYLSNFTTGLELHL